MCRFESGVNEAAQLQRKMASAGFVSLGPSIIYFPELCGTSSSRSQRDDISGCVTVKLDVMQQVRPPLGQRQKTRDKRQNVSAKGATIYVYVLLPLRTSRVVPADEETRVQPLIDMTVGHKWVRLAPV